MVEAGGVLNVRLLGPFELSVDGRPVAVGAGRLRALLAALAMSANATVSVDSLARAVWDADVPDNVRRSIQVYVSRLRAVPDMPPISTETGGYRLRVDPARIDALRFVALLATAAGTAEPAAERALLTEALALWRGTPFDGCTSEWLARFEAPRLAERRVAAAERRADLDLSAGYGLEDLVVDLDALIAEYPLREPLWIRQLTVLHRLGRTAEALDRYETVRRHLAEALGTDPTPDLQRVHAELLATGTAPEPGRVPDAVPRQLPLPPAAFTGRARELAELDRVDDGSPPVTVIAGMAGVGKTALAVHAAHRLAGRFPDGQLYVDLHGATAGLRPLEPLPVLGRFLRAFGTAPAAVPTSVEEAGAAFRSLVADRRLLVVLDNVADARQLVPLLPGGPGCRVLVTSRRPLPSLDGARHLHLDTLPAGEATELLARVAGRDRLAAEPEAAAEVAARCGWLPLALRIAGARLAMRPGWPVAALAERLAQAGRRLTELQVGGAGVRASFASSFEHLDSSDEPVDRAAAAAFALLGILDGPEVGVPVVARLLDRSEDAADEVLERLVDAQILETPAPGRYRMHDLLRLYARELAERRHPEHERVEASTRALGHYLGGAWHTLATLRPGDHRLARIHGPWAKDGPDFADERDALGWLDAERPNLLSAVRQSATLAGEPAGIAIQFSFALSAFFFVRSQWDEWTRVSRTALVVARRLGDRSAQGQVLNDLSIAYLQLGRYADALTCVRQGLAIRRELGDRIGAANSLSNLGNIHERRGRDREALACHEESLAVWREFGDDHAESISLASLGRVHQRLGRHEQALACLRQSLAIRRDNGDRLGEAVTLGRLGELHGQRGRYDEGLDCQRQSLAIYRELGHRGGEASSLNDLGVLYRRQGRHDEALLRLRESLALRQRLGDPHHQAESLRELGVVLRALGRREDARAHWRRALDIHERLGTTTADELRDLLATDSAEP